MRQRYFYENVGEKHYRPIALPRSTRPKPRDIREKIAKERKQEQQAKRIEYESRKPFCPKCGSTRIVLFRFDTHVIIYCAKCLIGDRLQWAEETDYFHTFLDNFHKTLKKRKESIAKAFARQYKKTQISDPRQEFLHYFDGEIYPMPFEEFKETLLNEFERIFRDSEHSKDHSNKELVKYRALSARAFGKKSEDPYNFFRAIEDPLWFFKEMPPVKELQDEVGKRIKTITAEAIERELKVVERELKRQALIQSLPSRREPSEEECGDCLCLSCAEKGKHWHCHCPCSYDWGKTTECTDYRSTHSCKAKKA